MTSVWLQRQVKSSIRFYAYQRIIYLAAAQCDRHCWRSLSRQAKKLNLGRYYSVARGDRRLNGCDIVFGSIDKLPIYLRTMSRRLAWPRRHITPRAVSQVESRSSSYLLLQHFASRRWVYNFYALGVCCALMSIVKAAELMQMVFRNGRYYPA